MLIGSLLLHNLLYYYNLLIIYSKDPADYGEIYETHFQNLPKYAI